MTIPRRPKREEVSISELRREVDRLTREAKLLGTELAEEKAATASLRGRVTSAEARLAALENRPATPGNPN